MLLMQDLFLYKRIMILIGESPEADTVLLMWLLVLKYSDLIYIAGGYVVNIGIYNKSSVST